MWEEAGRELAIELVDELRACPGGFERTEEVRVVEEPFRVCFEVEGFRCKEVWEVL